MNEVLFKFIKYLIRYSILFIPGSILFTQWSSFELSNVNKKSESIFRYAGIISANDSPIDIKSDCRVSIMGTIKKDQSLNGLVPILQGKIKISWNLSIKGRMASFASNERSIQMYGWGLTFKPGSVDEPSQWRILFNSGSLNSHNQLKVSSISSTAVRLVKWKTFPIHYGFGTNIINGISLQESNNYKLHYNFILFGLSKNFSGLVVSPQILLGRNNNYFSINILGSF